MNADEIKRKSDKLFDETYQSREIYLKDGRRFRAISHVTLNFEGTPLLTHVVAIEGEGFSVRAGADSLEMRRIADMLISMADIIDQAQTNRYEEEMEAHLASKLETA